MKNVKVYSRSAKIFKLVASTTRVGVLSVISKRKEAAVQEIAEDLDMTHSAISHQLAVLAGAGIVEAKKSGRMRMYSISKNKLAKYLIGVIRHV